ncbi:unnamed protein product [Sphagnum troendelagicum]|uniref:Uncharacterized protein n=1 Tax=Sphagnum troendelagicum TaxID=128251 RepID=A0ABP0TN54_9BRYO
MSINQNLLSTNTLSFITNTWNQSQASCGPTLREKGKRSRGREVSGKYHALLFVQLPLRNLQYQANMCTSVGSSGRTIVVVD